MSFFGYAHVTHMDLWSFLPSSCTIQFHCVWNVISHWYIKMTLSIESHIWRYVCRSSFSNYCMGYCSSSKTCKMFILLHKFFSQQSVLCIFRVIMLKYKLSDFHWRSLEPEQDSRCDVMFMFKFNLYMPYILLVRCNWTLKAVVT